MTKESMEYEIKDRVTFGIMILSVLEFLLLFLIVILFVADEYIGVIVSSILFCIILMFILCFRIVKKNPIKYYRFFRKS